MLPEDRASLHMWVWGQRIPRGVRAERDELGRRYLFACARTGRVLALDDAQIKRAVARRTLTEVLLALFPEAVAEAQDEEEA